MTRYIGRLMDEFVQSGVNEAVVCPGSRSTPLAMLALAHQEINVHVLVDERSLCFLCTGSCESEPNTSATHLYIRYGASLTLPSCCRGTLFSGTTDCFNC